MKTPPKHAQPYHPFPYAPRFLHLYGTVQQQLVSPIRRRQPGPKLMLRIRYDDDVTVLLERRARLHWVAVSYQGNDVQHLIPITSGEDVRLTVEGTATGIAELVEV